MSSDTGRDRYDDGGPRPAADAPAGPGEPREPGPAPVEASAPPTQAMPAATPTAAAPTQATPVASSDQQQTAAFDRRPTADSMDPDAGRGSEDEAIAAERNYSDTNAYRPEAALDAESLYLREHLAYGGVRLGSAFFGWLAASGLVVLITSVVVGVAAAFGMANEAEVRGWLDNITDRSGAAAITAGIALAVIVLLAYFGGGYVAGRMARFDGVRQGLAVWLWGVVMSVVAGLIGLAAGGLGVLTGPAPVPVVERPIQELTFPGLIGLAVVLLASLAGALLGGATGMRYHRAVDRSGFEPDEDIE
jgi:hypothetical protein